jgi:hypothetical protein
LASQKHASPARCSNNGEAQGNDLLGSAVDNRNSAPQDSLQVFVSLSPSRRKWRADFNGKTLCISTSPLIKSARILIAQGFDPDCMIETVRAGDKSRLLRGRLGVVAATVIDGEKVVHSAKKRVPVRFSTKGPKRGPPRLKRPRRASAGHKGRDHGAKPSAQGF